MRPEITFGGKLARFAWRVVWALLFRPSPVPLHAWRRGLLRLFGAQVGKGAHPYPACRVWAPWNLRMAEHSCLANGVDCYSVAPVTLGAHATVSQHATLCTATHDYEDPGFALVARPIAIEPYAWVAAGAFVGPGVTVGRGAVAGARAVVFKNVEPWTVVAGNPAIVIKHRRFRA
jgi:putative colanic acid biosynthesis acetyltransferase WcaF